MTYAYTQGLRTAMTSDHGQVVSWPQKRMVLITGWRMQTADFSGGQFWVRLQFPATASKLVSRASACPMSATITNRYDTSGPVERN